MEPAHRASRGDVWRVDLDPVVGHEQGRIRPAIVISVDLFNHGLSGSVVVVPLTSRDRGMPLHVAVAPPEGGLSRASVAMCDRARTISTQRLAHRLGAVAPMTIEAIEDRIRILLGL
ncbi:MAG TPA: type II toxin-antitoxin system PemK/MazF family toxin [Thermomicrobiales bacterium]|nr:type II toxin-antitoxin system PemK/MazF family toxin [Thermomicrobiales bacterium]